MQKLSDRIYGCRTAKGWSAQRLANESGVSLRTIQGWENNEESEPQGAKLSKVAQSLGVTVNYLRGVDEPASEPAAPYRAKGDVASECRAHIESFLAACKGIERRLHWTIEELRTSFPLTKWREEDQAEAALKEAAISELARRAAPAALEGLGLKQKAASTTDNTGAPKGRAHPKSGAQPPAQGQAPKKRAA
jgi:transcriptional regulator with XRE-family HTH domain